MAEDEQRPLDRSPYYVDHFEHLDRVLGRPQLAGIGISACVGGGLFITSGTLISTTGSVGAAISYAVAGSFIACVMYTTTEMVTARPLTGALIDLPHTFLDPACGFTVAALYTLSKICAMSALTATAAQSTSLLKTDQKPHSVRVEAAINLAFIALTTFSHCLGVRLYGKIERVVMWFKLGLLTLCCILMVVLNLGGGGPRQGPYSANYTSNAFTPGWNPTGFQQTAASPLRLAHVPEDKFGIPGLGGTVFAFLTSVTLAMFSCLGADLVAMTVGEAKNPWKDIPATMSFVYLVPLSMYPFVMFAAGANVNYADPSLPQIWMRGNGATHSPFMIAAQQSSLHTLPKALNALFILSAYTTANTDLYAASRSVFMLSQQYLPKKVANIFGRTNHGHTPLAAILLCSALGFLSLIGLLDRSGSQPRITLSEMYTGTAACINLCLCVTFLNFKAGLDRFEKRKIFSRNDPLYRSRLFRSRWQPLPAYIGIIGCAWVIIWSGIPPLIILATKRTLAPAENLKENLKSTISLTFDVLGAYVGPFLFAAFYLSYKYVYPRTSCVDIRNFTLETYVLEDLSTIELESPEPSSCVSSCLIASHEPAAQTGIAHATEAFQNTLFKETCAEMIISLEAQVEGEMQDSRNSEHERIGQILMKRPKRLERGIWRELWSFVVADRE